MLVFFTGLISATATVNTGIIVSKTTGQSVEGASVTLRGKIKSKDTAIDGSFEISKFISGQAILTIIALDAIQLMDALDIDTFSIIGHDWGANIAESLAVNYPERVERIAMLSTPPRLGGLPRYRRAG